MNLGPSERALWILADVSVRTCLMATAAGVLIRLGKLRDPAVRSGLWTGVLVAMLLVTPLTFFAAGVEIALPLGRASVIPGGVGGPEATRRSFEPSVSLLATATSSSSNGPEAGRILRSTPIARAHGPRWTSALWLLYLLGGVVALGRVLLGFAVRARLLRSARPLRREDALLACRRIASAAHVACPTLWVSDRSSVPFALPGRIVLPEGWSGWSFAQLESVLAHEMAHLKRRDTWTQLAARLNRAVHWFNPAATWVARGLSDNAERACDLLAIQWTGHSRRRYARHLVGVAAPMTHGHRILTGVVPMARPSRLRNRVESLLRQNGDGSSGRHGWVLAAMLVCLLSASGFRLVLGPASGPLTGERVGSTAANPSSRSADTLRAHPQTLRSEDPVERARAATTGRALDRLVGGPQAERSRDLSGRFPLHPGDRLRVNLPFGTLNVEVGNIDRVVTRARVVCVRGRVRCEDLLSRVRLDSGRSPEGLSLDISAPSSQAARRQLLIEGTVVVPDRPIPDLGVRVEAGLIVLVLPERSLSRIALRTDLGQAELVGRHGEGEFQRSVLEAGGQSATWEDGPGVTEIVAEVGAGTVSAYLN